ncbi:MULTISPECIES: bacteriophage abortive infection AbiH family protein [Marinomonas]|uniref:Bacteriophage abortive infection AbiH family protein n=1 Tax=Marinomonas arctica TaxID=383750 RepID=A0A7H1J7W7_9GAMM|nr:MULTISPECIES: bacteriophage abortive infection AbiH family protein [Marinomonas]QNT06583.1 bacteriophage abortive infection AbiH family protein [Marinomonas arctica]GGN36038.1 hypothetical protein GCM10011350_33910 [Marinomonas arctica]
MATLYIIGNGFDLYHRLPTSFSGFKVFTKDRFSAFSDAFENYFEIDIKNYDDRWCKLEESLSEFSVDELIEHKRDYGDDDPHEDQFNNEVEIEIDNLTQGLVQELAAYLSIAEKVDVEKQSLLSIDSNSRFLNFNYTNTLERIYDVSPSNICYIHGALNNNPTSIIIGHGCEFSDYEPEKIDTSNYTKDQLFAFCDASSENYERAVEDAYKYYNRSLKNTQDCISLHQDFFDSLRDVDRVIIFGHSLSDIDFPYRRLSR